MKLGVMSALFAGRTLEDTCSYIADIGLGAIELPVGAWPGKPFFDPRKVLASRKEQDRVRGVLKDHGLVLSALAVHGNPVHPEKGFAKKHHDDFVTAVELAPKLGTDIVITFSGCPGGSKADRTPSSESSSTSGTRCWCRTGRSRPSSWPSAACAWRGSRIPASPSTTARR
jgi:sugar phosphate isomerase/epimerase